MASLCTDKTISLTHPFLASKSRTKPRWTFYFQA